MSRGPKSFVTALAVPHSNFGISQDVKRFGGFFATALVVYEIVQ